MGKTRRERQKFHTSPSSKKMEVEPVIPENMGFQISPIDNIFSGVNINLNSLNKMSNDDTRSVRSLKSQLGDKVVTKREKMQMRKEILMKKIDTVQQMKKEVALRKKRSKTAIMGDTNSLRDALPSLDYLLKKKAPEPPRKVKGIEKASRRKKNLVNDVKTLKMLMENKKVKTNPLQAMTDHVNAIVGK